MWALVARLVALALGAKGAGMAARGVGTGLVIADVVNLDWLRGQAVKVAPGSDAAALEEAARNAARILGLGNDDVLWPRMRSGEPISPNYFVLDLNRGRAWMSSKYYSRKSVRHASRPRLVRKRSRAYVL